MILIVFSGKTKIVILKIQLNCVLNEDEKRVNVRNDATIRKRIRCFSQSVDSNKRFT